MKPENLKSPMALIALFGLIGVGYFGFTFTSNQQSADVLTNQLKQANTLFKQNRIESREIETSGIETDATRSKIWAAFNSQLQQVTAKQGVVISQIQIDNLSKPLPGIAQPKPGARTQSQKSTWGTNTVTFSLEGSTPQIYAALRAMVTIEPAFKITKISFSKAVNQNPQPGQGAGVTPAISPTLNANIEVSLLTPSGAV